MQVTKHTGKFYTVFKALLAFTPVTHVRPNLNLTAECKTGPRFSIPYPRYLPNFTAAIRHGEPTLQQPIRPGIFYRTYFIPDNAEAPC